MLTRSRPRQRKTGIFCIENWSSRMTDRTTLRPLLEVLEQQAGVGYIHRVADDYEDLCYLLERSAGYEKHRVLYIATHGSPGSVYIGSAKQTLDRVAEDLEEDVLAGKIVYFGSCATGADRAALRRFRESTGADVVCGYSDPRGVDWMAAAAFELLLMQSLTDFARPETGLRHLRRDPAGKSLWAALQFVTEPELRARGQRTAAVRSG